MSNNVQLTDDFIGIIPFLYYISKLILPEARELVDKYQRSLLRGRSFAQVHPIYFPYLLCFEKTSVLVHSCRLCHVYISQTL